MHRGGWVLHTLTALTHCTRPRYGVPNPSWKRRSDACLDQRSIGVLGWSWLIQVADVPGFSLWPRRREQEERIHKMAALKKQATARTWRPSAPFFWCQNGTPVIACHCINANPGLTNIVNSRFMTLTINWEGYPQNSDKLIQYYIYKYMCAYTWLMTLTKIHWFMAMGMALFCSGWGREESL